MYFFVNVMYSFVSGISANTVFYSQFVAETRWLLQRVFLTLCKTNKLVLYGKKTKN